MLVTGETTLTFIQIFTQVKRVTGETTFTFIQIFIQAKNALSSRQSDIYTGKNDPNSHQSGI